MNLRHKHMRTALENVQSVQGKRPEVQQEYLRLCRQIPALLLTNGVGFTADYLEAQSVGKLSSENAFHLVQLHMGQALGKSDSSQRLKEVLEEKSIMVDTLTLLDAWVYYKRFAELYLDDGEMGVTVDKNFAHSATMDGRV